MQHMSVTSEAIDIVTDSTGRNDSAAHIEGRNAADGESIAPMAIGHTEGIAADPRQAGDIRHLVEYAGVHRLENRRGRIDPGRHKHPRFFSRRNLPNLIGDPLHVHVGIQLHLNSLRLALTSHPVFLYTSSTTRTLQRPPASVRP